MKKYSILMTVLVLTISLLTGCGCTRRNTGMDIVPSTEMTIMPTNIPETTAPILPSTHPATEPTNHATTETGIAGTEDGITDSITGETNGMNSRIR